MLTPWIGAAKRRAAMGSPPLQINTGELKVVAINTAIAAAIAGVTYFGQHLGPLDLGAFAPMIATALSALALFLPKFFRDTTGKHSPPVVDDGDPSRPNFG